MENKSYQNKKFVNFIYIITLIVMAVTGFGQMPIFKRYYLANIPGFAWTADYYLTHYIHYLGAVFLLCFFSYLIVDYILVKRKRFRLIFVSYIRIFLLSGIIITGIFRVLKNMPNILFSPGLTQFIDIAHLGFVKIFIFTAIISKAFKKGWVISKIS